MSGQTAPHFGSTQPICPSCQICDCGSLIIWHLSPVTFITPYGILQHCIHAPPRGRYWEIYPRRQISRDPRDFPRAKPEGNLEGRGKFERFSKAVGFAPRDETQRISRGRSPMEISRVEVNSRDFPRPWVLHAETRGISRGRSLKEITRVDTASRDRIGQYYPAGRDGHQIHPCRVELIDSVNFNPSLVMMRECPCSTKTREVLGNISPPPSRFSSSVGFTPLDPRVSGCKTHGLGKSLEFPSTLEISLGLCPREISWVS